MKTAEDYYDSIHQYRKVWDPDNRAEVQPSERFWVENQKWLESRGYMLRPRYHLDWIPSWEGTNKMYFLCEDGRATLNIIMDATRMSDGILVALKMIFKCENPYEAEITSFFSTEPLASDPHNHCVPLLEVLEVPGYEDMLILVLPFFRRCTSPRFLTIGEAVEFFRQTFEGLQFMHKHHVAHRDCHAPNIMMDGTLLYPNGFHPLRDTLNRNFQGHARHYTRTEHPPKYYLIDFGLSRRYDPKNGSPLEIPVRGGDKGVPEFQGNGLLECHDPFPTDIYYLGNMIRKEFLNVSLGFDFMFPLVLDMVQDIPSQRPEIDEVVARFETIRLSLSRSQLRSRIVERKEYSHPIYALLRWWRNSSHFFRRVRFTLQRIPPLPPPGKSDCKPVADL